ncbi:fimA [Symbiodinium natans]|uniref:FimA protein n=1 Tax=Symbiodinium natans TaxID=878477 RepID=A0A812MBI3_9DINO|nr:fimA [Symbiodinium natans]
MAVAAAMHRLALLDRRRLARSIAATLLLIAASIFLRLRRRLRGVNSLPRLLKIRGPPVHVDGTASTGDAASAGEVAARKEATPPEVTSAVQSFAVFNVGENVFYPDGEQGKVVAIDEEGDLQVVTRSGRQATWYGSRCSKALSKGNRVRYACGEVAELVDLDADGDLIVQKSDGKVACWYLARAERLLSVGDPVTYVCGEVASVVGFDADGDVIVLKQDGRQATWFAHKCA